MLKLKSNKSHFILILQEDDMRNYCDEIQTETGRKHALLERYQKKFRKAAEWYNSQYLKYNKKLQSEMIQAFSEENNDEEIELFIDDYDDNFGAKLTLFCVADILCKHILSTFSYGPENSPSRQFQHDDCTRSWFEYKGEAYIVTEILQDILVEKNEGHRLNLSVLLEDRNVRSNLTHSGDIAICLSAIRCYNIIRDMIIFMDSDYESRLSRFEYPDDVSCDMQAFFCHTNNLDFNQRTTILVVGSLHDIPREQRAILSNMPWDLVIDFDAYSDHGGLLTTVAHNQIHSHLLTKETAKALTLKKGITEWLKCGELVTPSHNDNDKIFNILPRREPFFKGRFNRYYHEVSSMFKEIIQKIAQTVNPVTIVYINANENIARKLLDLCEVELDSVTYTFSGIYYWSQETIINLGNDVYSAYIDNDIDYKKNFKFISSDLESFFKGLKTYEYSFNVREDLSTDNILPSGDGPKELSINQALNVESYFEPLYRGCGQEDYQKAEELLRDFYRGGNAPWCAFANKEIADLISTDDFDKMINKIKTRLGRIPDANRDKIFYLEHAPGIGGSTLLRQIGWELRLDYPVLFIKNFDRDHIGKTLENLYDNLSKGIVVLADENFNHIEELEAIIKELPRACVLVAAVRQSNCVSNNIQKLPFYTITKDSEMQLRNLFKKNSPLMKDELDLRDEGYSEFISKDRSSMRCPFMIGLYYMDKHFNGVDEYADKVISNISNGVKEIKSIAFMALCDIYGQESLPAVFVNKYLGLMPGSNYIDNNESVKSAFYLARNQNTVVYKPKHYLLSQALLEKCSMNLYSVSYSEKLAEIANDLIDGIFSECKEKFATIYQEILEKVFIRNRIGNETSQSDFSKIIEDILIPERRKEILLKLATSSANLVDNADEEDFQQICMMTSHFYGHLSRLCSKHGGGIDNPVLAAEYIEKSMYYMEKCQGQDSHVYHMYGESKRAVLHDKTDMFLKITDKVTDSEYNNLEDEIDNILSIYSKAAQAGGTGYAFTSQMGLLIEYLEFVYRKKGINSVEQLNLLSPTQQKYRTDIEELISILDGVELDRTTQDIYNNSLNKYNSNIMMNDFGKAIEYYQNRLDYLLANHGTPSEILNTRQGLINARLGKYRILSPDGRCYYSNIPTIDIEMILDMLDVIIEQNFDVNRYQERQRRISTFNRWMQLAKFSTRTIDQGILVALKWKDVAEKDKKNDPRPYYYLYVLYYLSVLEGNKANSILATEYQKLSFKKALNAGYGSKLHLINDFFVSGTGINQLQDSNCIANEEWSCIIEKGLVNFNRIQGRFNMIESKKGIVEIHEPINWLGRKAKFNSEKNNDVGENQISHKIEFYGGFGFEQIIAYDKSVCDIDAGEKLPEIGNKVSSNNVLINHYRKEFIPNYVQVDNKSEGVYYLNGKVDRKNAGLSSYDLQKYGSTQLDAYGGVKCVMDLLKGLNSLDVICPKFNGTRYSVSLFDAGKTLIELLGEPKSLPEKQIYEDSFEEKENGHSVKNVIEHDIKEFVPIFVKQDYNTEIYYLNGKVDEIIAGLSSKDLEKFGALQLDAYGGVERVIELLNEFGSFQVKCFKTSKDRYAVSLFNTGVTLIELLGEPESSIEKPIAEDGLDEKDSRDYENVSLEIQVASEETAVLNRELLPDFSGEIVDFKVLGLKNKGVVGTFEKEGKDWRGIIPIGFSKKELKNISGKEIKAKILSKNENEYILKK